MELIAKRTISHEVYRHVFEEFPMVYIEKYENNRLKDNYFAHKSDLWPDGSLRSGGIKYFYSNRNGTDIQKRVEKVNLAGFTFFDKLYFVDEHGDIRRIDNVLAEECDYNVL